MIEIIKIERNTETDTIEAIHYHIHESGERTYGRLDVSIAYEDQSEDEIIEIVESHVDVKAEKEKLLKRSEALSKREDRIPVNVKEAPEKDIRFSKPGEK